MTSALLKGRFRVTRRRLSCGTRAGPAPAPSADNPSTPRPERRP